jgi:glycerol 3-phosphatase-2
LTLPVDDGTRRRAIGLVDRFHKPSWPHDRRRAFDIHVAPWLPAPAQRGVRRGRPVPKAAEALRKAREAGMRLAFVTNNASRTPSAVAAVLTAMGVHARAEDVVTSSQAAARFLAERLPPDARVLVVGGMGLRKALYACGLRPVSTAAERPAAVVQGFTPGLSYDLMAEGARAVRAGALFVASNADLTIPSHDGPPLPGNGSLLQVIRMATGTAPVVVGKPERPLHREAVLRTAARRPLVVGDRLDTDIEGAHHGDADSLLVLTGVTDPLALACAPRRQRPTYVALDLEGLLTPHPEVAAQGDGYACGGWRARWQGDRVTLDGDGESCDGLRAVCATAWRSEAPVPASAVGGALRRLSVA